jgi:tRNA 2-selenouridine synthase
VNLAEAWRLCDEGWVLFDVRSPGEYAQGHLVGAANLPLFDDAQRAEVGTLYSHKGADPAWMRALELVGPQLVGLVQAARRLAPARKVVVHCWRGGQRSASVAWLLRQAGFETALLTGGYRTARAWQRELIAGRTSAETIIGGSPADETLTPPLLVLGGRTGSGKTALLHALRDAGENMLDLEALANHRGSALGSVGLGAQPTTEQFINEVAYRMGRGLRPSIRGTDASSPSHIWIEDESRNIGKCALPPELWERLCAAPVVVVERPRVWREKHLAEEYSQAPREELLEAVAILERRLGPQRYTRTTIAIREGCWTEAAGLLLDYYDDAYDHSLQANHSDARPVRLDLQELPLADAIPLLLRTAATLTSPAGKASPAGPEFPTSHPERS